MALSVILESEDRFEGKQDNKSFRVFDSMDEEIIG